MRKIYKEYTEPSITTSQGVASILKDMIEYTPARRYAIAVNSHGMAWLPVRKNDTRTESSPGLYLTRYFGGETAGFQIEIQDFAEAIRTVGIKMEYILFDDCYMSSIEVAYELKDVTDYLIASPTEIMAHGMPYFEALPYMIGKVDYEAITQVFYDFYKSYLMASGTIAVTVCAEIDSMAALMKKINSKYTFDSSFLSSIQRMDGYNPVRFFDFRDYVSYLCMNDPDLMEEFDKQLDRTVPHKKYTEYFYTKNKGSIKLDTCSGIMTSDPSISAMTDEKTGTAWYKATH
ncbi:MAG: clostripain-related cysteine peptidase [Tannerellaceae bacterium]|nr:clostripain-related cysteine peptidase [Tannerellaceae bacterium]